MKLYYYSHRLSGPDREENLARARQRFDYFKRYYALRCIVLWAPWIQLAEAEMPEEDAWFLIKKMVRFSGGIVLDLDGEEISEGMAREWKMALSVGADAEMVGR